METKAREGRATGGREMGEEKGGAVSHHPVAKMYMCACGDMGRYGDLVASMQRRCGC